MGKATQIRPRLSAGSYLSQHDSRLHFGLGKWRKVERLEVAWPDGSVQAITNVPGDQVITIRQETARDRDVK